MMASDEQAIRIPEVRAVFDALAHSAQADGAIDRAVAIEAVRLGRLACDALATARAEERERAAGIADAHRARVVPPDPDEPGEYKVSYGYGNAAQAIATAIREGGPAEGGDDA